MGVVSSPHGRLPTTRKAVFVKAELASHMAKTGARKVECVLVPSTNLKQSLAVRGAQIRLSQARFGWTRPRARMTARHMETRRQRGCPVPVEQHHRCRIQEGMQLWQPARNRRDTLLSGCCAHVQCGDFIGVFSGLVRTHRSGRRQDLARRRLFDYLKDQELGEEVHPPVLFSRRLQDRL
jgi:hypothetical protein